MNSELFHHYAKYSQHTFVKFPLISKQIVNGQLKRLDIIGTTSILSQSANSTTGNKHTFSLIDFDSAIEVVLSDFSNSSSY